MLPNWDGKLREDFGGNGLPCVFGALEPAFKGNGVHLELFEAALEGDKLVVFFTETGCSLGIGKSELDGFACESEICVVLSQEKAVFRSAGEHTVGLGCAASDEIVE